MIKTVVEYLSKTPDELLAKANISGDDSYDLLASKADVLYQIQHSKCSVAQLHNGPIKLAAWNAERLKFIKDSYSILSFHCPDIILLSEIDIGMARSGNKDTVRELASMMGMEYIYGVEFIELGHGDKLETLEFGDQKNDAGYHGNAIMSRIGLKDPFMLRLDDGAVWFGSNATLDQNRLGGRMAIGACIRWNNQNVWFISVHLESKTDAGNRRFQIDRLLMYLNKHIGDAPCVIGGDLNTNTNCEKQLILNKNDNFIIGETETMFYSFKRHGFEWANSNTLETTQRSRPDGNPKPPFSKLDWILVRGLDASEPQTVSAIDDDGEAISDHEIIMCKIECRATR